MSLSFLPLSHSFERLVSYVYLAYGVTIVFAESMETVGRDLPIVRPTVMTGVPRVYEKFQARILERGARRCRSRGARSFTGASRSRARRRARAGAPAEAGRRRARARVGAGRPAGVLEDPRRASAGGCGAWCRAARRCRCDVAEFFAGIGLPITEGYGLTETSPVVTANPMGAPRLGTVGKPIPGVEVRIADDGEILVRGPNVMMGYYNKPEDTAAVLKDGWFHTGDIGTLDADGYLRDHGSQEGSARHLGRQEDRAAADRGDPQAQPARRRGGPARRSAALRRRRSSCRTSPRSSAGSRTSAARRRSATCSSRRDDVVALYDEIVEALNRELSQFERIKRFRLLPREFTHRVGRADADDEGEAQGRRGELGEGNRSALRVTLPDHADRALTRRYPRRA